MGACQPPLTLAQANALDRDAFVARFGFVFEQSPWIARAAWERRPFADANALHAAMIAVIRESPDERQLALIAAHPDLAGRLAHEGRLTAASGGEQAAAGLDQLTPEERARFDALNARYRERFGFPFVICAREHAKDSILSAMAVRLQHDRATEIGIALDEITKIARLRLAQIVSA